jgi:predicted MPP superfamily phosphohydrolase
MFMSRIIFFILFVLSFYGGTNFYIARRLFQWINLIPRISLIPLQINIKAYVSVYIFVALSMFISFFPIPIIIKNIMNWIGSHWMGMFGYLLLLFLAADILILLGTIIQIIPHPMFDFIRFVTGSIVVITTIILIIQGKNHANQINYVSYNVQTKKSISVDEMKIVLLSDLHLGTGNTEKNLPKIVQGINNLKPDIVCITGDIFNDDYYSIRGPENAIVLFRSIESKYGVYACLGNHDGGKTFTKMLNFLEQSNITLLNDEYRIIDDRIVLIGRVDSRPIGGFDGLERKGIAEILVSFNSILPIVVMDHDPSNIRQYGNEVDLLLFGHTHGGQIFPGNLITKAIYVADYGHYQKDADSPHIVVTSGISTWGPPMRIGTNNEIVTIVLK